jgi:hypothetical protein
MRRWDDILKQWRVRNVLLEARARLMGAPTRGEPPSFAAYFKRRDEVARAVAAGCGASTGTSRPFAPKDFS